MELADFGRSISALILVIGLIILAAWAIRRFLPRLQRLQGTSPARLAVLESRAIDARNRLVLVRCDDVEHLLVVGPQSVTALGTPPRRQDAGVMAITSGEAQS